MEELAEQVAETPARFLFARLRGDVRKIESAKAHPRAFRAGPGLRPVLRIEAVLVEHLLLFRIAQDVVGLLNAFEALFGRLVARVEVGMVLAREAAVRLPNFIGIRGAGNTQRRVVVLTRGRHNS